MYHEAQEENLWDLREEAPRMKGPWFMNRDEGPARMPRAYAFAIQCIPPEYKESGDAYDWVPMSILYGAYIRGWWEKASVAPEQSRPEKLDIRQFAIAAKTHFANCESCRRHQKGGVRSSGLCGLTGPNAERSPDTDETYTRRKKNNGRS